MRLALSLLVVAACVPAPAFSGVGSDARETDGPSSSDGAIDGSMLGCAPLLQSVDVFPVNLTAIGGVLEEDQEVIGLRGQTVHAVAFNQLADADITSIGALRPSLTPDGGRLYFVNSGTVRTGLLSDAPLAFGNTDLVTGVSTTGGLAQLGFSSQMIVQGGPDQFVIYVAGSASSFQATGAVKPSEWTTVGTVSDPSFSPDGLRLVFVNFVGGIYAVQVVSRASEAEQFGDPVTLYTSTSPVATPKVSDDCGTLYVVRGTNVERVRH